MPNRIQVNGTIRVLHTRKMLRNAGRLPAALEGVGAVAENKLYAHVSAMAGAGLAR